MKSTLIALLLFAVTAGMYGQEFATGTLITTRYDTISDVKIEVLNDAKSLLHVTYIDANGEEQQPKIDNIKCYTRGDEVFCRIYNSGEMVLVKQLVKGTKLNLYKRSYNGSDIFYIEKVYDELIKVPASSGKFRKVLSAFLDSAPDVASKIKTKELNDILEIVNLYNKS